MSKKILVVDDEPKILQMISEFLATEGFEVITVENGREAVEIASSAPPDLMVLDIMLPEQNGLEVCRKIRTFSELPIIMLTAKSEEIDKLVGLELGADDYLTKPFSLRELAARIRAVLRRLDKSSLRDDNAGRLCFGKLALDPASFEARLDGVPVPLTPTEFKILHFLATRPGQVFSRLQILENVFGEVYEGYERSVDTHISNIRKKIEPDPSHPTFIHTVYGVGYKFAGMEDQT